MSLKIVTEEFFNPKEILLTKKCVSGAVLGLQWLWSQCFGVLWHELSETPLWYELFWSFWFCHTLLIISCWEKFCHIYSVFSPWVKIVMEFLSIYKETSHLGKKPGPPQTRVPNTNYRPFDFSLSWTNSWSLLLLLTVSSKHFWGVGSHRLLWEWQLLGGCG